MSKEVLDMMKELLDMEKEADSFQFGKTGERHKIYYNLDDPEQVKRKIDNAVGAREYARMLDEDDSDEAQQRRIECMEQFLEGANGDNDE